MRDNPSSTFLGNIASDPVIRQHNGRNVLNFRFAVNEPPREDGSQHVEFFDVTLWGRPAGKTYPCIVENLSTLPKGCRVAVIGRLRTETNTKDGVTYRNVKIMADEVLPSARHNPVFTAFAPKDRGPQQVQQLDLADEDF